jgi:hypothetical protein
MHACLIHKIATMRHSNVDDGYVSGLIKGARCSESGVSKYGQAVITKTIKFSVSFEPLFESLAYTLALRYRPIKVLIA